MKVKKIIGIVLIILSLLLAISFLLAKHNNNGGNNQSQENKDAIPPTENSELISLTNEQKDEGINAIYNDTDTGILIIDK
jgi:hypothetical protein